MNTSTLDALIDPFIILALSTAVYSAAKNRLESKMNSYRLQTAALSIMAFIAATFASLFNNLLLPNITEFYGIALILASQAYAITHLLAYVTNDEKRQPGQSWLSAKWKRMNVAEARPVWTAYDPEIVPLAHRQRINSLTSFIFSLILIAFAYAVAFKLSQQIVSNLPPALQQFPVSNLIYGLGASLALLLVGLFNMINSPDVRSQIMGLFVMENGLFLAAIIVIIITPNQHFILAFLLTIITWYVLTWIILLIFLPRVRQYSGSIYVDDQKTLKE
jgi:hydrogenase-4 membrane subunit HyfE